MYPMRLFSQSPKKAPFEKDLEKCLSSGCEEDVVADPVRSEGGEKALSYKSEFVELAIEHDAVGTGKGNDAETVGPVRIISSPSASRIQSGNSRAEVTPDLAVEASVSTPSKKLRQSSSFSGFSSREAGCGVSRTMAQGGGSFNRSASDIVCGTPRSGRSIAGKPPVDADTTSTNRNQGVLQKEAVTPSKNANRALKYGGAPSNASFVAGLSSTRATSSAANQLRSTGTSGPVQISSQLRNEQHFYLEDDPSFWQDHNVQVLIRIRPLSSTESVQGFGKCVRQENAHTISWLGQPESRFTFDHVAGEMISQEELFQVAGLPMVTNCMAGYNSCMFAYGQTGSGKTHTMLGDIGDLDHQPSDNRGMTPRVFECLFAQIRMAEEARKCENLRYMCKCSFLEIYNEQITDLLDPSSVNLQLREDINKGVYVENLTEVEVQSVQDVVQLLLVGAANRRVAATNMNRESSRSHSVFTCIIQSQWECDSMINFRFGRLNLVDLAGSERQKSSGAEGDRLKEAVSINKSLSTLGLVIMVLVDIANGKQRHVPYRDSKLSFLLQDSLGGNSKTTIIANISPSSCSSLETLSTLRFAQRAKFIQNNAVVNEDASGDVNGLRQQIQQLKEELARLRRQSISRFPTVRPTGSPHDGILEEDDSLDGPTPPSCSLEGSFLQFGSLVPSPTILTKKIKMLEANLTGALRREQEAELSTKRFGLEIEHANRLVKELEENTQYNKLILQFREDKIRRLESLSTGVLSADAYLMEENNAVMEELQLLRDLPVQNPELTRLAMENLCLHEQLRRFQEFDIGGEREAMAQEISHLRDQLVDALDSKLPCDSLPHTQMEKLLPERAAENCELKLLQIEVAAYQSDLEECRKNLTSSLESNSMTTSELDALRVELGELKAEHDKNKQELESWRTKALEVDYLELVHAQHLQFIAELKAQLKKSEETVKGEASKSILQDQQLREALQELSNLQTELQWTKEALDIAEACTELQQKANYSTQINTETLEEGGQFVMQLQQQLDSTKAALEGEQACRRELEEKIACFRSDPTNRENMHHETEIGSEALSPATKIRHHDAIMQLEMELDSMDGGSALLVTGHQWQRGGPEFLVTGEGGTEMQHSVTIMQLQLDLESAQTALEEERANLKEAKQQSIDLKEKLQGAVLKLEEDKALIEALEDQQIFSINELESLQAKHQRVIELLRRREEKERVLKHRIYQLQWELKEQELQSVERELCEGNKNGVMDEACRSALEMKLVKARMELEKVQRLNHSFQAEKAFHSALEQEMDVTRLEAESETALAITSMQSELIEMRAEVDAANQREAQARKLVNKLEEEVKTANAMLENVQEVNTSWASKYKRLKWEKHKELLALQQDWEGAAARVMDYLTKEERKTDKEGKKNTGSIGEYLEDAGDCHHLTSCKDSESAMDRILHGISKNQEVMETTKKHMSDVHQIATMASDMVKHLGDSFFCSVYTGATEEMKEVWKSYQETKVLKLKLESCEAKLREVGRKANAAFIMACWISEAIRTRQIAQSRLRMDLTEGVAKVQQKEMQYECQRTLKNECAFCEIQDEAVKAHEGLSDLEEERVQLEKFEIQVQESGNALENLQAELKKAEIGLQEVHCIALKMAVAQGGSATTDCGWRSSRKMSTVTPENNSDECVLLVENALNGAQQQLQSLRTENCDRRAWDITAVSEVKEKLEAVPLLTDGLQGQLNEKEEEITKLKEQIAEQFEEWSSRANIDIPSVDTQAHLLKNDQATLAVQRRLADPQAQFNSTSSEVGSFIDFQETHGNVQMNKAIGIMNMELLLQKEEKIICLNKEFHETEVNAKKLPEKLDAFALSEQAWRSEKQSLCDEIESLRSCLATRVRACEALQKENLVLEEKGDAATRAYQSSDEILHNMERKLTKITVELAEEKRRAEISQLKLTGAEERVKVLLEAHSVMTDEWATERQSLHSEKDLLKIELSRLELHSEMQGGREQPLRNLKENRAVRSFDHGMSTAKHVEKLCQELERTRTDNVKLQTKLRERDSMLLSVRLELSAALADCKHAEAKLEQAVEERQALLHVEEELRLQISFLTEELQTLQEEVSWRQKHVDACQFQLESLTKILMETEERTHEAEQEWRKEKVQIETELQKARTNAHERHVEAVALSAKFKEWQGTLQDADLLVNALVQANDSARQDAWQWKLEKESMGSVQVEQIAQVLEETLEAVAVARKEVDVLMRDIECQMEDLIAEIRILKVEIRHKYWKVETGTLESGEQQKEKCADAFGDSEVGGYYVSHIKCLEDEQKQFNTETAVLVDNKSPIRSLHAEVMRSQKQIVAQRDHAVTLQLLQEKEETVVMLVHELNKLKHSSNHLEKEVRTKVEGKECGRDSNLRQSFTLKVVKEKDDTLNLLKEEREHLKSMVEGLESEVLEWQQRCLEAETALKEKVRTIADLQSEIDESHERLGEQVTTLADQLEERNQHVSELECQRMELREEMQRQAIAFASLHEQLQRQDCSLEGEAKSIAIKVSEEKEVLRTLEEEKAELKSMVERLDAEVRFFERKAADVETSMAEMERIRLDRESLQVKLNCVEVLQLELDIQNSKLSTMAEQRSNLEASLTQKTVEFNLITEELNTIRASAASVTQESEHLKEQVGDLEAKALSLEQDLLKKQQAIDCLEAELVTVEENMARCLEDATADLKELASERDALHNELLMLSKQLVVVQALADEREAVVAEAQQVAELSRSHAEEKQQEAEILGKSVEELETTVYVLESQLEGLKRDMERQRLMREDMEMELQVLNNHMSMLQAALDEAGARSAKELLEAQFAREEAERMLEKKDLELLKVLKKLEKLQTDSDDKAEKLKDCRTQITVLLSAAEKQASEFESKLKAVEIKLEERKCQHSTPKAGKLKGTGSTFTCIGMGHQVHSELAEDRISYELRIQELETLLSSQHKENSMLNDKLVEAEKMTYDVVHDLLGVKSNISNVVYGDLQTLLGQQQAELLLQNGCNNSPDDAQEKEEALENLTSQLNDFIQERESWLEEIKQKQAEVLAARLSTDKLRERDKRLIEENNKFKAESIGQQKRIGDLEQEMRKLSGQQNLQQRIQHHAKIKDENNALRIQNDELSGKLRRAELLYARVNDELSKYRSADGKQPFLDIDEEQRLCNMLQEAEADRVQMAHTLLGLCTSVMKQASGITVGSEQNIEPSAALEALEQLTQQLASTQQELSDCRIKIRIEGERQRLEDLRAMHSPMKPVNLSGLAPR